MDDDFSQRVLALRGLGQAGAVRRVSRDRALRHALSEAARKANRWAKERPRCAIIVATPDKFYDYLVTVLKPTRGSDTGIRLVANAASKKAWARSDNGSTVHALTSGVLGAGLLTRPPPWPCDALFLVGLLLEFEEASRVSWPLAEIEVLGEDAGGGAAWA